MAPSPSPLGRLRIVLVRTRNALNLGAAARAMSNFGALELRVVHPFDLAFREARSAVGPAADVLAHAEEFASLADAVADCALVVGTTAIQAKVAIVFGSEKTGLSNFDLGYCHWLMHIPTRDEHLSMNLGQAVAVTLYELSRDAKPVSPVEREAPATAAELERLTTVLLEALEVSGYATPETVAATEEKARRLLRRMEINARDAEVLLGMVRQILWKLTPPPRDLAP